MSAIRLVIDALKSAPRLGADLDSPEGVRYIVISETLVNKMVAALEDYLLMKEKDVDEGR